MKSRFSALRDMLIGMEDDFIKFYDKGNKAAGTRVRKGMKDMRDKCQEVRMEVQKMKNTEDAPSAKKGGAAKKSAPAKKKR